jgi:cytokinin dehydrogenase
VSAEDGLVILRRVLTRRGFLAGLGATAVVVGFEPVQRIWVSSAAATTHPRFEHIPPLDGTLLLDPASRQADSRDLGRIVEQVPYAVLRPGSVRDIQKMIWFCRRYGIKVATRGQGHTTHGQGLVQGLIIENRSLRQIHSIGPGGADVDAGVLWRELAHAAGEQGLTPPAFTTYVGLSIAGTLSVGGFPAHNDHGLQIDRVRELEVVTGEGELVRCSLRHRRDLFEVMLGGLGQCGVITRATVDLVPARALARTYLLHYPAGATAAYLADMRTLVGRGELDGVYTLLFPQPGTGALVAQLNGLAFYDPDQPPDDQHLLRGLNLPPAAAQASTTSYLDWVQRYDPVIEQWRQTQGWDDLIKPWFDVILPSTAIERYAAEVIPTLTFGDFGPTGIGFVFPQRRSRLTRPFFRIPAPDGDDLVFLFDILTSSVRPGPDPAFTSAMLARNRRLYDKARAVGGTRYPIGALDFTPADWQAQYGERWPELVRRKRRYDPDHILTPGPGIFGPA